MSIRLRIWTFVARGLCAAALALGALAALPAWAACGGNVALTRPVALSPAERAQVAAMAPLVVLAADAPPMAHWDEAGQRYTGVGVDALCFIATQIGLRYEIEPGRDQTVAQKIARVQAGGADVFLSLSLLPERARRGLFTEPYYETYYAIIGRKGRRLPVHGLADLAGYRVGVIKGVAFEPILRQSLDAGHLVVFDQTSSDGMFEAVRHGRIDVAVYPAGIFEEKRYQHEYFDLTVLHTLRDEPRPYRFYFSASPAHEDLVRVFDRYLAALDVSQSVNVHEDGERQFIARYVAQRSRQIYWQAGGVAAALLAIALFAVLRRDRLLMRKLAESNQRILRQQQAMATSYRKLKRLSRIDGLTRLPNRRNFDHALVREYARRQRTGAPLSVMMIDIDHFKCVNDHYGHAMGDDYLRAVARVLKSCVTRSTDLAARYGGEEFVCLLPDTDSAAAVTVAERIRHTMAQLQLPNPDAPYPVLTLSLGIATLRSGQAAAAQLLELADAQLYEAKKAGRDRVCAAVLAA